MSRRSRPTIERPPETQTDAEPSDAATGWGPGPVARIAPTPSTGLPSWALAMDPRGLGAPVARGRHSVQIRYAQSLNTASRPTVAGCSSRRAEETPRHGRGVRRPVVAEGPDGVDARPDAERPEDDDADASIAPPLVESRGQQSGTATTSVSVSALGATSGTATQPSANAAGRSAADARSADSTANARNPA